MLVKYDSNNSGGRWWLSDEDWFALEKAGWKVDWVKDQEERFFHKKGQERWLGALAKNAEKEFETPGQAMREFEKITGQTVSDEGCNCCGAPHSFSWDVGDKWGYASGEDCLSYMYKNVPQSIRDMCSEEIE
jgi:hypothetical protein